MKHNLQASSILRRASFALVASIRELKTVCLMLYFERLKALRLARHLESGFLNLVSACLIGVNSRLQMN